jgi:pSer/pThr/pTyr-binding forkhead associated (FHA) protein
MEVRLIVLEGKHKDREIPLPETIFLIGRDRQCHLRPHCPQVSKLHCAVAAWAGRVRLRDLRSRNGTLLNGKAIQGEVLVDDGDQLQVGSLVFAFRIKHEEGVLASLPIKDEREVQWLLESPADSSILAGQTRVMPTPAELDGNEKTAPRGAKKARGGKTVSAGQHLRTYFEARKRRPGGKKKGTG